MDLALLSDLTPAELEVGTSGLGAAFFTLSQEIYRARGCARMTLPPVLLLSRGHRFNTSAGAALAMGPELLVRQR
jgi:hypothetical protein